MTPRRRWLRMVGIALAVLSLPVLALTFFLSVQQQLLRWRAGQLLGDIRSIQMGKSTWADAERIRHRWGAWGMSQGPCTAASCDYQIVLSDLSHTYAAYLVGADEIQERSPGHKYTDWQAALYRLLGGRVAAIYARIQVKNGIIWTRSFDVNISMTSRFARLDHAWDEPLVGASEGVTRMISPSPREIAAHPEFRLYRGACSGCEISSVTYTPQTALKDQQAFLDFDLSCLTRWMPCTQPKEIMPSTAFYYQREEEIVAHQDWDWKRCPVSIEVSAREAGVALLVSITAVHTVHENGETGYEFDLRALQSLKNHAVLNLGRMAQFNLIDEMELPGGVVRSSSLKPNDQLILTTSHWTLRPAALSPTLRRTGQRLSAASPSTPSPIPSRVQRWARSCSIAAALLGRINLTPQTEMRHPCPTAAQIPHFLSSFPGAYSPMANLRPSASSLATASFEQDSV